MLGLGVGMALGSMPSSPLNIDDFGARANDTTYEASLANGVAIHAALAAANARVVALTATR